MKTANPNQNDSLILAQSNILTEARYDFDVVEKRILFQIIKKVRKNFIETERGDKTLWSNLIVNLSHDNLKTCDNISRVRKSARKLRQREIFIDNIDKDIEGDFITVGYINYAEYSTKTKQLEIEVSKKILPYLVALAGNFTTYDLTVAMTLKCAYSQRFYELCSQYKNYNNGYFFKSIEQLRTMFMLEQKYKAYKDFRIRVIESAQKEIKELYDEGMSDLYFTYDTKDKQGKKVISLSFYIHTREREKANKQSIDDYIYFIRTTVAPFFKRNTLFIDRIVNAILLNPDLAGPIVGTAKRIQNKYDTELFAPYFTVAMNEDYNIKAKIK